VLEEEPSEFSVLRRSWTNCTDCAAGLVSFVWDGELLFFRSLCTVAKRIERWIDPSGQRAAERRQSVESWNCWTNCFHWQLPGFGSLLQSPECSLAPFRSPEERLLARSAMPAATELSCWRRERTD